jgi:RNA exonuclease 4
MVFFTKKQKALMRERRKKVKPSSNDDTPNKSKLDSTNASEDSLAKKRPRDADLETAETLNKRPRNEESEPTTTNTVPTENQSTLATKRVNGKLLVAFPPTMSAKDAKKFRKESRRQLRLDGSPENEEIEFVTSLESSSEVPSAHKNKPKKKFPSIQELLQQKKQLAEESKNEIKKESKEKKQFVPDQVKSQYVAIDCEMVGIGSDGKRSALARVSVVDWDLKVLLDTFVQVPTRVTDFRTHVSGVTANHIKTKTAMEVVKCRVLVASLLKDKILVGHALSNDLKALLLQHPKHMIRDTSKYRPFQRFANAKWRPRKLRDLVRENLQNKEGFQVASHDSVDDSRATMELFQIVHSNWEKEFAAKTK